MERLRIVPANEVTWDDLQSVLTGPAAKCQCERQRLGDRDWWYMPVTEREDLFRTESGCDDPRATSTTGIVGFSEDEPVAWCAVDRRATFGRLRGSPVPWKGRLEDKDDESVWAIACLVVRKGYRGRGYTYPMVAAAVDFARSRGAAAIEGYPMVTGGREVIWDELNVGPVGPFAAAGFTEVSHPTKRRVVMRRDLAL
ncbi:GNAT family N-acetyltransferase [Microbacterium sp. C7(2022)]|uniref:GNAT family N-acetyltransferase n=1 Tax=Microbacterium sp. C7(2022) TaxID=2992759 RepID=UPI00237BD970|nr:GNAT family N-acetyltransferase [Microbacterium sp. C7(2022)]MDE0546711.1 GNAT family N-acetyltransferase [Microbacterium sp. C7(2022)]